MTEPYSPIDCDLHDQLLALATLRRPCTLDVRLPDGNRSEVKGVIEAVYTETGAAYLRLGNGATVRLDRIDALNGRPFR